MRSAARAGRKQELTIRTKISFPKAAQRLAKEDGVSLNQWIAAAVAEKIGVVETAAEFFKKRAGRPKDVV